MNKTTKMNYRVVFRNNLNQGYAGRPLSREASPRALKDTKLTSADHFNGAIIDPDSPRNPISQVQLVVDGHGVTSDLFRVYEKIELLNYELILI